ncbi:MAG TPA: Pvc16 family protein [Mariprofundaceae bacterium]|nr:Pvc16 family protein [Mariprofundaceae bacterium]
MLPIGSLSAAATSLRQLLADKIADLQASDVLIGHPKPALATTDNQDPTRLNLFFYHATYDGYPADGAASDPFFVRLYCLITPCGGDPASGTTLPSAGENDLRLIGEVMRVLHEYPVVNVDDADQVTIARLQIVPHALSLDGLNHIWSTQADTAYRLSVAYEMALAPVPLVTASRPSPVVGSPSMLAWGRMDRDPGSALDGAISLMPEVEYLEVDTGRDDWIPHICLVVDEGAGQKTLHYVRKIDDPGQTLNVLVAGQDHAKVKLFWSVWRRNADNSVVAWQEDIADGVTPEFEIRSNSPAPFFPGRIDPDPASINNDMDRIASVKLPSSADLGSAKTWQAMLHAVHAWEHEYPAGSGQTVTTRIKSNTVLLYGGQP